MFKVNKIAIFFFIIILDLLLHCLENIFMRVQGKEYLIGDMPVKNYSRQKHAMFNIGKFMSRNGTFDFTDFPLFLYLLNEEE